MLAIVAARLRYARKDHLHIKGMAVGATVLLVLILSSSSGVLNSSKEDYATNSGLMFAKGMNFPTYSPDGYESVDATSQLRLVPGLGADWVAIIVILYQDAATSTTQYSDPTRTASDASLSYAIGLAHSLGLKVLLKPHLSVLDGTNHQDIQPSDVNAWFQSWDQNMVHYAQLAAQNNVEMFWIGGELDSMDGYASNWRQIVSDVRAVYSGPLVYGSSQRMEHFTTITWWDAVDYAGIDAYFPLATQTSTPTLSDLNASWTSWITLLNGWQRTVGKPVIFTEIGYNSVAGANQNPAMNAQQIASLNLPVDVDLQALLYTALFQNFYTVPWLRGTFIWFWPSKTNLQGPNDPGFSPQGKPAQDILTQWYHQDWTLTRSEVSGTPTSTPTTSSASPSSSITSSTSVSSSTSTSTQTTTTPSGNTFSSTGTSTIIPGFPWESILLGIVIGFTALLIARRRKAVRNAH